MSIPVRLIVPLLLFALLALQAVYLYLEIKKDITNEILDNNKEKISISLRLVQDNIETIYRQESIHLIQNEISKIATDPYVTLAVVVDDSDKIIAASDYALYDKNFSSVISDSELVHDQQELSDIGESVRATLRGQVSVCDDGGNIYGVYPIGLGASSSSLRPDRVGMIVIVKDMKGLYREAEKKLLHKFRPVVILILTILFAFSIIFYYLVGRRLTQLEQATVAISDGDSSVRVEPAGNDELGKLAQALNTMAERIQVSQNKLSESERQFQNLEKCSPVGIFRTDTEGNCVYVNKRWEEITGMSSEQAMAKGWHKGISSEDLKRVSSEWEQALVENRSFNLEFRFNTGSEGPVWVLCQAVAEIDHAGNKIGYIGTLTDITERTRYQQQLEQQSMIIDQTHDAVILTDMDGFVARWNRGAEKLFGHAENNAVGRHISFLYPEDEKEFIKKQVLAPVLEKNSHETETRMIRKSGELFYAHASMTLLRDSSGKTDGIINYIIDISDSKRAEEELSRSEASLSEAQRIARLGNWSWDILDDRVEWSDEIYRIFGLNPQQFVVSKDAFFRLVHPEDRSMLGKALHDALYKMAPYSIDHRICLPDRSVRYVHEQAEVRYDDQANPLLMIGTTQDITDRVFAERALRRSETRFRSTFEQAAVGVAHIALEGHFLLVNQRLCDIVGYSREELIRLSFDDITYRDDVNADRVEQDELINHHRKHYSIEKRFLSMDGDVVWTNLTVSLVAGASSNPDYFLYVVEDITARKEAEEKIERSLKEKESLLQELHHRVKNNMQIISSILSLQSRNINPENIQRVFNESKQRIKAMALVHERLYSSGDLSYIDIKEYLEYLASKLKSLYSGPDKDVVISVEGDEIRLPVDSALPLALIVNELLTNAIHHAYPVNEAVRVDVKLAILNGSYCQIEVRDYGEGFDEDGVLESERSSGLTIIRALAAQLHADIAYNKNDGTQVTVTVPLALAENESQAS